MLLHSIDPHYVRLPANVCMEDKVTFERESLTWDYPSNRGYTSAQGAQLRTIFCLQYKFDGNFALL